MPTVSSGSPPYGTPAASSASRATATAYWLVTSSRRSFSGAIQLGRLESIDGGRAARQALADVEGASPVRRQWRSREEHGRKTLHARSEGRDDAKSGDDHPFGHVAYVTIPSVGGQPARTSIAIVASALMLCGAAARDLFDDIYARSHGVEASIRTVTAHFTEESTSSLLSSPVVSRGSLAVIRPDRIVMRYTDPAGRILLIDGDQLTLVWPSRGVRRPIEHRRGATPNRQIFRRQVARRVAPELCHRRQSGAGSAPTPGRSG